MPTYLSNSFGVTVGPDHNDLTPASNYDATNDTILFTNGGWSTSFDYAAACTQRGAGTPAVDCATDGLQANDGIYWTWGAAPVGSDYTQAVAAANNSNGSGGLGARFWVGDGSNVQSAPIRIDFPSSQKEIWVRWYMRYESGFAWSGGVPSYDKWLYIRTGGALEFIPGANYSNGGSPAGGIAIACQNNTDVFPLTSSLTWADVFGTTSDGLWHMIECYMKIDTDGTDGILRMWCDGQLTVNGTGLNLSEGEAAVRDGMDWFDFHQNQSSPANGRTMYVDYDDLCIFNTDPGNRDSNGYPWIGPINGFSGGS